MNILGILNTIADTDPEVFDRIDSRRKAMRGVATAGKAITLAAVPTLLSGVFTKAYGRTNDAVIDALQLALKAEYLEAEFYVTGVNAASALGVPADITVGLRRIAYDELLHVSAVRATIVALGGTPDVPYVGPIENKPAGTYGIDITGGGGVYSGGQPNGPFKAALSDKDVYLAAAQVFEDTGVRAYKGQAGNVITNKDVLAAALGIHSVEARHASWLRKVRGKKGWVSGNDPELPGAYNTAALPFYAGEETVTQAGINVTTLGSPTVASGPVSQSFDEPEDTARVLALLTSDTGAKFIF